MKVNRWLESFIVHEENKGNAIIKKKDDEEGVLAAKAGAREEAQEPKKGPNVDPNQASSAFQRMIPNGNKLPFNLYQQARPMFIPFPVFFGQFNSGGPPVQVLPQGNLEAHPSSNQGQWSLPRHLTNPFIPNWL